MSLALGPVTSPTALVTLAQVKAYMGLTSTTHDEELTRLIASATGGVQEMAGPTLIRDTFTETYTNRTPVLLRRYPVLSVQSVSTIGYDGVRTTSTAPYSLDLSAGRLTGWFGASDDIEVAYTAGLDAVPDEAVDAALVWISYKYRRNHGGSETYMPAGVEGNITPPMGVRALTEQVRLALGQYARGPRVA